MKHDYERYAEIFSQSSAVTMQRGTPAMDAVIYALRLAAKVTGESSEWMVSRGICIDFTEDDGGLRFTGKIPDTLRRATVCLSPIQQRDIFKIILAQAEKEISE